MTLDTFVMYVNFIFKGIGVIEKKILKLQGHQL